MRKDGTGGTKRNRILRNTEHRRNIRIANGRNDTEHNYTIIRNTERIYGTQLLQYVKSKVEIWNCKWSERYGTQLYDNTEHGTHLRNAIITVRNVKGC